MIIPFSTSASYSLLSLFAAKVFMKISMNILNVKSRKHGLRKLSPKQSLYAACRRFHRLIAFAPLFNGLEPLKPLLTKILKRNQDITKHTI